MHLACHARSQMGWNLCAENIHFTMLISIMSRQTIACVANVKYDMWHREEAVRHSQPSLAQMMTLHFVAIIKEAPARCTTSREASPSLEVPVSLCTSSHDECDWPMLHGQW